MQNRICNLNDDDFEMECIVCGRTGALSTVAHRNKRKIVGFLIVCRDCVQGVYGAGFKLVLPEKEKQ